MPYTASSQGAQANCASVFMATLDPLLVAAGYVFVEEVANVNQKVRVYKSPAASNFFGQDWFLIVRRDTDPDTNILFSVTEQYNSTTHLCFNYAPSGASLVPTAQFAVNDGTGKAPYSTSLGWRGCLITTAAFNYWCSLTPDRVVIAIRYGTTDTGVYVGLYDDFHPAAASPFPLITTQQQPGGSGGYATREPNTTTGIAGNFSVGYAQGATTQWTLGASFASEVYSAKPWLSRRLILGRSTAAYRGLLRGVWSSTYLVGVNGDTLTATVDGVSKTLVQVGSAGSGQSYFFADTTL